MLIHPSITATRLQHMLEDDHDLGLCTACGAEAYGVEPDAREYECDVCGARAVFGAEELLFTIVG